ncbi:histidine kinase [Rhizobium rhizosphaerae]|uniref:Histidine kinase n=1 Tax=Xaviernesmea rhizosphaerae TaxID=1672749 RepID=A0A1Q9AIV2_9HYPH|nr:cache domain-containing protein [Xaviernesmea rhizosphaerae]OLP55179.1 histidine kinase [Xaviernesmea rhizosphaerae]OQP83986.1 histidine kinase [Xaviernesmea rhizosphaerae]
MTLRQQIIALAIVPLVLAIVSVTSFITWQSVELAGTSVATFERNMLSSKETEIVNLTSLANSAIRPIYEAAGPDDEAAKRRVIEIVRGLDYGRDGYFFIYDYAGNSLVHPRQEFLPGHNWLDLQDPDGNRVIANLIARAKDGGGFHRYKWNRPSTGEVADKVSFVVALDKWGWILGTGVYLDEIYAQTEAAKSDIRERIRWTFLIVALVAIPATLLVFSTCMMITLRERRLADARLKQLTQRVIDTQEEERARLARELHDGISQSLLGVRYRMDLAGRKVAAGAPEAEQAIRQGVETLNAAIKDVRRLSHDLRPRLLDDLGIVAALRSLLAHFEERTGIQTVLTVEGFEDELKSEPSTALYRIAQEALTNVERHAGASRVDITLWSARGRARMRITDNGHGFVQGGPVGTSGLGLRNMQERMAHFRGVLVIRSDETGTVMTAMMPKSANRERQAA